MGSIREREEMERRAWARGMWEIMKESVSQKLLTWHLPSPPFLLPGQLSGLTVIVTGATSGIGLHTARELVMAGAHVVMACRNIEVANCMAHEWRAQASDGMIGEMEAIPIDLLSLSSVLSFALEWEKRAKPLHVLVNNAGAFYMKEPQRFTEGGIKQHMQVNHIAPALLILLLLPSLLKAPSSRIVNVNSVAHHCAVVDPSHWTSRIEDDKFNDIRAYGESKLAQTLARKLSEKKITSIQCIAVSPGIVNTKLVKQVPISDWKLFWMFSPAEGARSVVFCATSARTVDKAKGFAYYSYACKPTKESPQAMDVDLCLHVWQKTLEILHLDVDYLNQVINC
ncbi:dehydrogenase/reductase SDR family member FEY-like isoform X2 [Phoenix dactylifera]|uniref:Dehydrogenase/reductase SDR family member FEY-like isoform X2 n=1 Tax=Phoenix dactylifera TaxID=42345 RepID=A0A8B8J6D6_PHODC|nr:dehydrogenase/reductase SDR family member FEY-like isoform X2 [Phoenix dactylifera]